ncbi:MAG TPA: thiamine-phosphate kinase [Pyrinomonadaceae bacterium]|jgi:thiamine-monophosphate kinase|nr:thiamine-phosphate kinase [Pyrinomonadaceae bacterium]
MGEGEFDLIETLRDPSRVRRLDAARGLVKGVGDDAAVLRQSAELDSVITTDLLVENIDFKLTGGDDASNVGRRAVAVSLSDIAAMGARPRWLLLSVGVPLKLWERGFARSLLLSAKAYASDFRVALVGGDLSRTPERVVVDSIVVGEVERGRAVLRSGAKPGDQIYVTGFLGGAAYTLRDTARQSWHAADGPQGSLRETTPHPRVELGSALGSRRLATAMIDISDGLSSDLAHLCRESGVGARVEAASLPLDPLLKQAGLKKSDALSLALHGGEDFELLFTVSPRRAGAVEKLRGPVPVTRVGEITADAGRLELVEGRRTRRLKPSGFEHFARGDK